LERAERDSSKYRCRRYLQSGSHPIPNKGQRKYPQMPNIIITENGINKLLQNINIHKASGPDNIHGRILKECTTQIAPILTTCCFYHLS
jgi:hypothetical protein